MALNLVTGVPGASKTAYVVTQLDNIERHNKINLQQNQLIFQHNEKLFEKYKDDFSYYEIEVGSGHELKNEIEFVKLIFQEIKWYLKVEKLEIFSFTQSKDENIKLYFRNNFIIAFVIFSIFFPLCLKLLEQVSRIELPSQPWQGYILPLNHTCMH